MSSDFSFLCVLSFDASIVVQRKQKEHDI